MRSLFGKMMATYVALSLVIFVTLAAASTYLLENYFSQARERELLASADKLINVLAFAGGDTTARMFLDGFSQFTGREVWVTDEDGVIVMASGGDNGFTGERLTEEEARQLQAGQVITRRGTSPFFSTPMLSVGVPMPPDHERSGAVLVHAPLIGVQDTINGVRRLVLYAALASIGVAAVLIWILSRWISAPLATFTRAVGRLATGQFDVEVPVPSQGGDEVARLGEAFNHLSRKLKVTIHQLRQESAKLGAVVRSMQDGVVFVNQEGVVELANETACQLARDGEDPLGRSVEEVFGANELADWFRRALEKREKVDQELQVGRRVFGVRISPVSGRDGFLWGAVGALHDMSNQRALERMRRDFVVNISHELRTPLTSIRGFLEAAVDGVAQSPEEVDEYLRIAMDETERMRRLVLTLMDLTSIESGRVKLTLEPIHLRRVAMTVLDKLTPQIRAKRLRVTAELEPGLPTVQADSDKLEQILMNLLHNAVRHTPEGGSIVIGATLRQRSAAEGAGIHPADEGTGDTTAVRKGAHRTPAAYIQVHVTDSGPGLSEEEMEHVWDRFYKGDQSRLTGASGNGAGGGAGLGLAIVKELVEAHGGQVGVTGTVGRGSSFYFTLPLTQGGADVPRMEGALSSRDAAFDTAG